MYDMLLYACALVVIIPLICHLCETTRIPLSHELYTTMSTYNVPLQPPGSFRFDHPDEWVKWKQRFEQFCQASGLSAQSKVRQVYLALHNGRRC